MTSKKQAHTKLPSLYKVLAICLVIVVGLNVVYQNLRKDGYFVKWELLDIPERAEHLIDATAIAVWVETSGNGKYYWTDSCVKAADVENTLNGVEISQRHYPVESKTCRVWLDASLVDNESHQPWEHFEKGSTCSIRFDLMAALPGKLLECVHTEAATSLYQPTHIYYALLADGTVWRWSFLDSPLDELFSYCIATTIGLTIGLIFFVARRQAANKSL